MKKNCGLNQADRNQVVHVVETMRPLWQLDGRKAARELTRALAPYEVSPAVEAFLEDLQHHLKGGPLRSIASQKEACLSRDDLIVGFFSSQYNASMGVEAFAFERVSPPPFLNESLSTSGVPLRLLSHTSGFKNKRHVALFLEEMRGLPPSQLENDKAFYFVNRFAERAVYRTRPLVLSFVAGPIADLYETLSLSEAEKLATAWVWLHEHFHRSGPLALPEALAVKSTRSGGALEELRTDLRSIEAARIVFEAHFASQLELFILGERLIRYGLEASPLEDYDARSSQILCKMLLDRKLIGLCRDKIVVNIEPENLSFVAADLAEQIEAFELTIRHLPLDQAKRALAAYARSFLFFDDKGDMQPWAVLEQKPRSNSVG